MARRTKLCDFGLKFDLIQYLLKHWENEKLICTDVDSNSFGIIDRFAFIIHSSTRTSNLFIHLLYFFDTENFSNFLLRFFLQIFVFEQVFGLRKLFLAHQMTFAYFPRKPILLLYWLYQYLPFEHILPQQTDTLITYLNVSRSWINY